jgi:hypothetical protein
MNNIRDVVRERIERHIDPHQLQILRTAEGSERELPKAWTATYGGRS